MARDCPYPRTDNGSKPKAFYVKSNQRARRAPAARPRKTSGRAPRHSGTPSRQSKKRKKARPLGFVLYEIIIAGVVRDLIPDTEQCILDSGASSTFVRPDTPLTNPQRIHRAVRGAGDTTLRGRLMGGYGPMSNAIAVETLSHNLVSVGAMCDQHNVHCVFTSEGCYALPADALHEMLARYTPIARRADNGLYTSSTQVLQNSLADARNGGAVNIAARALTALSRAPVALPPTRARAASTALSFGPRDIRPPSPVAWGR